VLRIAVVAGTPRQKTPAAMVVSGECGVEAQQTFYSTQLSVLQSYLLLCVGSESQNDPWANKIGSNKGTHGINYTVYIGTLLVNVVILI
jgi:hypothetical protein